MFSIKDILAEARAGSITTDHVRYSETRLEAIELMQLQCSPPQDDAFCQGKIGENERLTLSREALPDLLAICYNKNRIESSADLSVGPHNKLDEPTLRTDPHQDAIVFQKLLSKTRRRYLEQPEPVELGNIDMQIENHDRIATHAHSIGNRLVEKFNIDRESVRFATKCLHAMKSQDLAGDYLNTEPPKLDSSLLPSKEDELPLNGEHLDSALQEGGVLADNSSISKKCFKFGKSSEQPGSSLDNPITIDDLGTSFSARCSMTPEIADDSSRLLKRSWPGKLASPLTPPNTVRPHRIRVESDTRSVFQARDPEVLCPASTPDPSRPPFIDIDKQPDNRNALDDCITDNQTRPRMTPHKIELPELADLLPSLSKKWTILGCGTSEKAFTELHDLLGHRRVVLKEIDLLWVPWAPYTFDPTAFETELKILTDKDDERWPTVAAPLNPQTQVTTMDSNGGSEELKSFPLPHPATSSQSEPFSAILRKRNLELMQRQHRETVGTRNPVKVGLETSFSDIGFDLIAAKKTKFGNPEQEDRILDPAMSTRVGDAVK